MRQIFFELHPVTVLLALGATLVVFACAGRRWPGWTVAGALALAPVS
jgi:hypothetical protein